MKSVRLSIALNLYFSLFVSYTIDKKRLAINDEEAKWVKRIFDEVHKGTSTVGIKKILDSHAVAPRRKNGLWSLGSINAMLKNTHYSGYYVFTDSKSDEQIQVQCPSIVDTATWKQAQHKRSPKVLRKTQKSATVKNFYLLRDLMFCGHCGRPISGRIIKSRSENSYYCPSRVREWVVNGGVTDKKKWQRGLGCGFTRALNIQRTDELVWDAVKSLHENSSLLKEEVRVRVLKEERGLQEQSDAKYKAMQAKLKTLQRKYTTLSETLGNLEANRVLKELNDTSYRTMTLRINTELRYIESLLSQARSDLDNATNGKKWLNWLKTFGQEITDLDSRSDEQKKAYIEGLVKQIDVRWNEAEREHELTLTFHLPIVNDGITWRDKENYEGHGRRAKRYDTYEGTTKTTLVAKKKDGRG
jgi:hypothetical protein